MDPVTFYLLIMASGAGNASIFGAQPSASDDPVETDLGDDGELFATDDPDNADPQWIKGGASSDYIVGGGNDDKLSGRGGANQLFGGAGNDLIYTGSEGKYAYGGAGDDRIIFSANTGGSYSNDFTHADDDAGDDFIRGGRGGDFLTDNEGANTIYGGLGADVLDTRDVYDSDGADLVFGGFGADNLQVDDGDIVSGGANGDVFDITFRHDSDPVTITDFNAADGDELLIRYDTNLYDDAGNVIGAAVPPPAGEVFITQQAVGEDTHIFVFDRLVAVVQGVPAVVLDDLDFRFGAELVSNHDEDHTEANGQLFLTSGSDHFVVGPDQDPDGISVVGGNGNDEINTGAGDDRLSGGAGNDDLFAGFGDDTIFASAGDDVVFGGPGDDLIRLGSGRDVTSESWGFGDAGDDTIFGGGGSDTIRDFAGANTVYGGGGGDFIRTLDATDDQADTVYGGTGGDRMFLDDGDVVYGGSGDDRFAISHVLGDDPVIVKDYSPGDQINIFTSMIPWAIGFEGQISQVPIGGNLALVYNGVTLAIIEGVSSIDADQLTFGPDFG
ncbi:MAG: calcium-binding protein [Planktomarina sp.]